MLSTPPGDRTDRRGAVGVSSSVVRRRLWSAQHFPRRPASFSSPSSSSAVRGDGSLGVRIPDGGCTASSRVPYNQRSVDACRRRRRARVQLTIQFRYSSVAASMTYYLAAVAGRRGADGQRHDMMARGLNESYVTTPAVTSRRLSDARPLSDIARTRATALVTGGRRPRKVAAGEVRRQAAGGRRSKRDGEAM